MTKQHCSFCGAESSKTEVLIAAKKANICDRCVGSCLKQLIDIVVAGNAGCASCTRVVLQQEIDRLPIHRHPHIH